MYDVAVPDVMVPLIADTSECVPGCITLPDHLLDEFTYVPPDPNSDETCGEYEPNGLCVFNPLCSFYSTPRPATPDRPMRQPFVPENCVTCNCGDDEYCPYDSGEVDELGRPMCGEGVNNCINGPDPLMC